MSKTKRGSKRSFNKKQRRRRTKYLKNKKGRLYGGLKIGKANVDHTAFKVNDFVKELDILNSFYQGIVTEPNSDIPLKYSVIAQIVANTLKSNKDNQFDEKNTANYHSVWHKINNKVGNDLKLKIPCYVELVEAYFINNTPNKPFLEFLNELTAYTNYDELIADVLSNYQATINNVDVKNLLGQLYESDHTQFGHECVVEQYIKAGCKITLYKFAVGEENCTEKIVNKFPVEVVQDSHETKKLQEQLNKITKDKQKSLEEIEKLRNEILDKKKSSSSSSSQEIGPTDWNPFLQALTDMATTSTEIEDARKKEQLERDATAARLEALKSVIPEKKESDAEKRVREIAERQAELNKLNLKIIKKGNDKENDKKNDIENEKNELMTQALRKFYEKNVNASIDNTNNYLDFLKTQEPFLNSTNFPRDWKINMLVTLLEKNVGIKGGTRRKNKKKLNKSKYKRTRRVY